MAEVIRRLEITELEASEFDYALHMDLHKWAWEERSEEQKQEYALELERARKDVAEAKKEATERAERAEKERLIKAVRAFLAMGKDIPFIAGVLDLSIEETSRLADKV